jgi:cytochrome c553
VMRLALARWGALFAVVGPTVSMGQLPEPVPSDVERGEQIYVICGACHGSKAQGEQRLNAPGLAGQQRAYLLRQLRDFHSGMRGGKGDDEGREMRVILDTVSNEADWQAVIAYIQSLPVERQPPTLHGDPEAGRQLYTTCSVCHGANGEGNESLEAPSLRSLPDWYILEALQKYRLGTRGASSEDAPGARMRAVAASLRSDGDLRAVASFIVSR